MIYTNIQGRQIPLIGQGASDIGECISLQGQEINALQFGIDNGLTLIDTAEMYGDGLSEILIGKVLKNNDRNKIYITSKILPQNVQPDKVTQSVTNSLRRLGTDYIDYYLLHWRADVDIRYFLDQMHDMITKGYITSYGVSNFDTADMLELYDIQQRYNYGNHCVINQVLYNIVSRGIEYDLLDVCSRNNTAIMSYCPLAINSMIGKKIFDNKTLNNIANKYNVAVPSIMIAFIISKGVITIPKSTNIQHIQQNIQAASIRLDMEDIIAINNEFVPPTQKKPLDFE